EIYGLTKGQAGPTTPSGDKTKSTAYGNPDEAVDPCGLAIAFGAAWVARGFAFLNIMSPCVTWRGDDQFKELRAKVRAIPADHDRSSREAATRFCNEQDVVTTGVLYEVKTPTLVDEMLDIRWRAQGDAPPPARDEILAAFMPKA